MSATEQRHKAVATKRDRKPRMVNGVIKRGANYHLVVQLTGEDGVSRKKWFSRDPETNERMLTQDAANKARARVITQVSDQAFVATTTIPVAEWLSTWLESRRASVQPGTYDNYKQRAALYLIPEFGGIQVRRLTTTRINRGLARMFKAGGKGGKQVSATTVGDAFTVLRMALKAAERDRIIARNPAVHATLPRDSSEQKETIKVLTRDQVVSLLKLVKDHRLFALFHVAVHTGMRREELCGLQWTDVDFENKKIAIKRAATLVTNEGYDKRRTGSTKRIRHVGGASDFRRV